MDNVGIFSVQESHWGFDGDWSSPAFHFVHSSSGKQRSGGILVGLKASVVDRESIKWKDVVRGRLLQVRCTYKKQQLDVISIYQHAMSFSDGEIKKDLMQKRRQLWKELDTLLGSLPTRSSILLMGDFNTSLEPTKRVCGFGVKLGNQAPDVKEDRSLLVDILRKHHLCALNTWSSICPTYEHPQGCSQIDYICVRAALADGLAKQSGILEAPIAAWRSSGHSVVAADVPLNWQPWKQKPHVPSQVKSEMMPPVPVEVTAAEENPSLMRLAESIRQHGSRSVPKPQKPPLADLGVEIRDLWSINRGIHRSGRFGILLEDCFQALKQNAALQKAHRTLRSAARARKRDQTLCILKGAEEAAASRDSRKLYQHVRMLSPKISSKRVHLRGAKGELLEPSQELVHLADYARKLFMGGEFVPLDLEPLPPEWFTAEAWSRALAKQRSHKAVPRGSASVVSWKAASAVVAEPLSNIATQNLCNEPVSLPDPWLKAQLIWIAKPNKPPIKPENLRSLGLMTPDTKAFLCILKERADPYVQARMSQYPQYAYRQGTSTYDPILRASLHCRQVRHMLSMRKGDLTSKIVGKAEAELVGGIMASIDLTRAFDMVEYASLHYSLLMTGMPSGLANVLVELHRRTELSISHGGGVER